MSWRRLYCVLRGGKLFCYYSPEEIEAKLEPALTVSINKVKLVVWGFIFFGCWGFLIYWIILGNVLFGLRNTCSHLGSKFLVRSCWYFSAL